MRNPNIASGTVVRITAATLALGLIVQVGASVGKETAAPTLSPVSVGEAAKLAPVTTAVTVAVAAAAEPRRSIYGSGGTVTLALQRTDLNGPEVNPGDSIQWKIVALVTVDNDGLALISIDLIQSESNPELIDLPLALRPSGMVDFDRPNGIANPDPNDPSGPGSAYGGTQIAGATGGLNLIQIGGAQNTFGEPGETIGLDTAVDRYFGHVGQIIATGSFSAPNTLGGPYAFDLSDGVANTLDVVVPPPVPPECWPVHEAIMATNGTISFTVVP